MSGALTSDEPVLEPARVHTVNHIRIEIVVTVCARTCNCNFTVSRSLQNLVDQKSVSGTVIKLDNTDDFTLENHIRPAQTLFG